MVTASLFHIIAHLKEDLVQTGRADQKAGRLRGGSDGAQVGDVCLGGVGGQGWRAPRQAGALGRAASALSAIHHH